jgi:BirA family biotin operon repressor/biotin-[acetyl-CoA-carboxylase] ligase
LLSLLADGKFHSGTELAAALAISRSAVWKHLQALSELGIDLMAVSGKGYKLAQPLKLLERWQIESHLHESAAKLLQDIEVHDVIASTNSYLLERAHQNAMCGLVCLAEYQSAGKGRRGKTWISPFGHNIYLSILWHYQNGPASIAGLSLAIGVALVNALQQAGIDGVGLKWPNDIYWRGRKLAGILIEVSGESSGPCHAVIGLGLNLYLPESQGHNIDQAWVDLSQIMGNGQMIERNKLVALLLNQLLPTIADFETLTLAAYLTEWRRFDCMLGKPAAVSIGLQHFQGIVRGIDEQGMLLLEQADGQVRSFASGEVSLKAA